MKKKVKVSGVPYEVELPDETCKPFDWEDYITKDDMIAELERENQMLRARNERLEKEIENATKR